jgi:hypothetical protein
MSSIYGARNNPRTIIFVFFLLCTFTPADTFAVDSGITSGCEIIIDDFANGINSGWTKKSFKGTTDYIWGRENGIGCIRATSRGTASSMYYRIEYDPEQYPYITWQWKVDNIVPGGDATKKECDDYGARVYVVFPAFPFWKTKAINYIWANKLPKEEAIPNPYTNNSIMISVESGRIESGKWLIEARNVSEDYRRLFGEKPPHVGAIAIMTDSDNTGEQASAAYGTIAVCSKDPRL